MLFHVSLDELRSFARQFWNHVKGKKIFAFHGEMGAGKTTIISALCHYRGVEDVTGSPTFSIINEYSYSENGQSKRMFHIDLYRLKDEQEVVQAGVEDCVYSGSICMIEWPEKAPDLFDADTVHVLIEPLNTTERKVEVKLPGE